MIVIRVMVFCNYALIGKRVTKREPFGGMILVTFRERNYNCPMEMTIDLIGGKWKALLLWNLSVQTLRFSELQRQFPLLTQKMLTQQLRELTKDGLIERKAYDEMPPRVEYSLTEFGRTIMPVLYAMNQWGTAYLDGRIADHVSSDGVCTKD